MQFGEVFMKKSKIMAVVLSAALMFSSCPAWTVLADVEDVPVTEIVSDTEETDDLPEETGEPEVIEEETEPVEDTEPVEEIEPAEETESSDETEPEEAEESGEVIVEEEADEMFAAADAGDEGVPINEDTFPDEVFRTYVTNSYDRNNDGSLSESEIQSATYLYCYQKGIASLQGIEYLTSLTTLICSRNRLTSLDLSNNTALTYINCSSNALTSLDLSNCTAVYYIDCSYNTNLASLDLGSNTVVSTLYCQVCNLSSLDVSNLSNLHYLNCNRNALTSLNISNSHQLVSLQCNQNYLSVLDIQSAPNLTELNCSTNNLTSINLAACPDLKTVVVSANPLTNFDISHNLAIETLYCANLGLTSLDLSAHTALKFLYCSGNMLTSLDLSHNTALTDLYCQENYLTSLDLSNNTALTYLNCSCNYIEALSYCDNEYRTLDYSHNPMTSLSTPATARAVDSGSHPYNAPTAAEGNVLIDIEGTYDTTSVQEMLDLINSYRYEACVNHYPDPRDRSRNLDLSDYRPVQWSYDLEEMAMVRAAEASYNYSHYTFSGDSVFERYYALRSATETLAFTNSCIGGIRAWYGERNNYLTNNGGEVGHYVAMMSPNTRYIGVAGFLRENGVGGCCAGEYIGIDYPRNTNKVDVSQYSGQITEVRGSYLLSLTIDTPRNVSVGNTIELHATGCFNCRGMNNGVEVIPTSWGSDNPEIISVDAAGNATCLSEGTATVYCVVNGVTYSLGVNVLGAGYTGWYEIDGQTCYYDNGTILTNSWLNLDGVRYYLDENGTPVTGWKTIDGSTYYFGADGVMRTGVQTINGYIYFFNEDGTRFTNGDKVINGVTYHFDEWGRGSTGTVSMYRLYNPNSGEHFYTADWNEAMNLYGLGWNYEGVGWTAPRYSQTPVYRLYNPNAGEHHYTTSLTERDYLISIGWNYEGIGWYSDDARSVPLYRQYNPNAFANNHNYTTSYDENNYLVSLGWQAEGVGWYGVR